MYLKQHSFLYVCMYIFIDWCFFLLCVTFFLRLEIQKFFFFVAICSRILMLWISFLLYGDVIKYFTSMFFFLITFSRQEHFVNQILIVEKMFTAFHFYFTRAGSSCELSWSHVDWRPSVCKLFTFSSSSPETLAQFQPRLAQSIIGWRGFKFEQIKDLFLRKMIVKIHWSHFQNHLANFNQTW